MQAQLIAMPRRREGATISRIVEAIGGSRTRFVAGSPMGCDISSEKVEGIGRVSDP